FAAHAERRPMRTGPAPPDPGALSAATGDEPLQALLSPTCFLAACGRPLKEIDRLVLLFFVCWRTSQTGLEKKMTRNGKTPNQSCRRGRCGWKHRRGQFLHDER